MCCDTYARQRIPVHTRQIDVVRENSDSVDQVLEGNFSLEGIEQTLD